MAAGVAVAAAVVVDDQEDGFASFLAFLQSLDDALVHGGGPVECSGDEFFANGNGFFSLAADVGGGCGGDADVKGTAGVPVVDDEFTQVGMDGDQLQAVEAGREHVHGGLDGAGLVFTVDGEVALGVEGVGAVAGDFCLHNRWLFRVRD